MNGRFCATCGSAAAAAGAAGGPPPSASGATPDIPDNLACAFAYFLGPLSAVLMLVIDPYSKNPKVKFHAYQSLFVGIAVFVAWFALLIVSGVLMLVPLVGAAIGSAALGLFGIAWLALWVVLMVKAYQGEQWKVPVLGDLAEKQAYTN